MRLCYLAIWHLAISASRDHVLLPDTCLRLGRTWKDRAKEGSGHCIWPVKGVRLQKGRAKRKWPYFETNLGYNSIWTTADVKNSLGMVLTSCHGRCRVPGCFVGFFLCFSRFFVICFLMMAWVGVGSGGMLTFM